jgi:hypothetical protein
MEVNNKIIKKLNNFDTIVYSYRAINNRKLKQHLFIFINPCKKL